MAAESLNNKPQLENTEYKIDKQFFEKNTHIDILQIILFCVIIFLGLLHIILILCVYKKIKILILSFYNTRNNDLAMFSI